jgi:transposase
MRITLLSIDLAKTCFQLHGADAGGKTVLKKKLMRNELLQFTAQLPQCVVAMEACGGSHYWARKFKAQGHEIKLIAAHLVKPFKKSRQKNDARDAEAINEAVTRPRMHFVAPKELWQQDIQSLHRHRQHFIDLRTATINQCRGLLMEYGRIVDEGVSKFFAQVPALLEDGENELTSTVREISQTLLKLARDLTEKLSAVEKKLKSLSEAQDDYHRLLKIPGIGPMGASMFLSSIGNPKVFKNGRHAAAWLGLVPRQESSGGKERLLGITKTGDNHLRATLIHGARALIVAALRKQKKDPFSQWVLGLYEKKGWNVTAVAIANRNCRIMWHLTNYKEEYRMTA